MRMPTNDPRMVNFQNFLAKNKIGINQLARALDRSPNGLRNMVIRGQLSPDLQMDVETVLTQAGLKLPRNLWVDINGKDQALPRRNLRHLHSGDVIPAACHSPLSRERRLNRYLSPNQLDPRKESLKLQPLTLNARRRFGLQSDPFRHEITSIDDVLETPEHQDAVAEMLRAARHHDFIALVGEVGSGKTTCLQLFLERLPRNVHVVKTHTLDRGAITGNNILDAIITDLAGEAGVKTSIPARRELKARKVIELLKALKLQDRSAVVILDEGQGLSRECLKSLKRLHEMMDKGFGRLLAIIILGQRELIPKLEDPTLREVGQRCARFEFRGLGNKTSGYLKHKISRAGGDIEKIFEPAALKELEKVLTQVEGRRKLGPYPLQLNTFCTLALNLADDMGENFITTGIIDMVKPYSPN